MCTANQEPRCREYHYDEIKLPECGAEIVHESSFMNDEVNQEDQPTEDADDDAQPIAGLGNDDQRQNSRRDNRPSDHSLVPLHVCRVLFRTRLSNGSFGYLCADHALILPGPFPRWVDGRTSFWRPNCQDPCSRFRITALGEDAIIGSQLIAFTGIVLISLVPGGRIHEHFQHRN